MFKKFSFVAGVVLFAAALLFAIAPQHAFAKGGGGGGGKDGRAKGLITAVDTVAGTLTINDRKAGSVTVTVTSATQLRKDSKKNVTLAMVFVGDSADARYDSQTLVASRIDVKSAKVEGTITAIDLTAQTVTIQPLVGNAVTVQATAATKIERNELHATLADFIIGDRGEAQYNAGTMIASKIEATAQ